MALSFFNTYIADEANDYISKTLKSAFLSEGVQVRTFESKLSQKLGIVNPIAVNSGTSALHLSLLLAGIGKGDEVIIPAQTFIATGLAVLYTGAKPVFADIQYETGNIDPFSIKHKINPNTKAIIPVHWGGYPCDMAEIAQIAADNDLIVIEDAAHALGASYKNMAIGAISDYTCFSFQAIKHLTTGDGGAVCVRNTDIYKKGIQLRWFGIDRENSVQSILGEREYDLQQIGYKYHMNDYAACLGLANLKKFEERLNYRRKIADLYTQGLNNFDGITCFQNKNDRISAYWFFGMHVENRVGFIKRLKEKGIPVSVVHLRIDKNKVFGGINEGLQNQARFNKTQINLPIHDNISIDDASFIIDEIRKGW